jgi:hypothetical protein
VGALLVLALATPAGAATLSTHSDCDRSTCYEGTSFVASAGEQNDVTLAPGPTVDLWRIRDAGAPLEITAGASCTRIDDHAADCPNSGLGVQLLDGDDRLRTLGDWAGDLTLYGGEGDDDIDLSDPTVESYARNVLMDGGPGNDHITGPVHNYDGYATIRLSPGQDVVDAGPLKSTSVSTNDASPWHVDLAAGTARKGSDLTRLLHVRAVDLGTGTLRGASTADTLVLSHGTIDGRAGADLLYGSGTLLGGGGDDWIRVYGRRSQVRAGSGDDRVELGNAADRVDCGLGSDVVHVTQPGHWSLARNCESFSPFTWATGRIGTRPTVGRTAVAFRVICRGRSRCHGRLAVRGLSRIVAFTALAGRAITVRVPCGGRPPTRTHGAISATFWAGSHTSPERGATWTTAPRTP